MRSLPASILVLALSAILLGSAGAESSKCDAVARQLRPGSLPPASLEQLPGLFTPLGADLDAQRESDVITDLQKQGATPALMAQVKAQANCDTCGVTLTWFANHTAAIVRNEAGDMHCVTTTSLKAVGGHLDLVTLPTAFGGDCPDTRLLSGKSDNQAYLAQEYTRPSVDAGGTNVSVDTLIISRWSGAGWGQPCQVRNVYLMLFFELHLNCADSLDCNELRKFAITDAAAAQAEQSKVSVEAIDERSKQTTLFAKQYTLKSSLPFADTYKFPDFRTQPNKTIFMDRDGGLDGTGSDRLMRDHPFAGGTLVSLIWQENEPSHLTLKYPSWVVTQWLEAGGTIRPVAGFVVHQKPGVISIVSAGPAS